MRFDNEDCYNYHLINETDNPVIPSSDVTIILMMEGSDRFKYNPFISVSYTHLTAADE